MNQTPNSKSLVAKPYNRPLTLVVAFFFLLTAVIPMWLLFSNTKVPEETTTTTTIATNVASDPVEYMTTNEKIESIASAIEKACYSDGTLTSKETALSCTRILLVITVAASLFFSVGLSLMYFSPKMKESYKFILSTVCTSAVVISVLLLASMYVNSSINIINRLSEIPNDLTLVNEKMKDTARTEHLYFLFRNIAIVAGLALLVYRLPVFTFRCGLSNKPTLKLLKSAKKLSSAYTAVALICCFYVTTICLTWEFNFTTKALLVMSILFATLCFMMIALLSKVRQYYKDCLIAEQNAKETQS